MWVLGARPLDQISFTDMIAVVALIVSVLAFFVAIYAIFQAARYRRGEILIDVDRERDPLENLLRSLNDELYELRPDIFPISFRVTKTDDERAIDLDRQRIAAALNAIWQDLEKLPRSESIASHKPAESTLSSLIKLRVRADATARSISACRAKVDAQQKYRHPRLL